MVRIKNWARACQPPRLLPPAGEAAAAALARLTFSPLMKHDATRNNARTHTQLLILTACIRRLHFANNSKKISTRLKGLCNWVFFFIFRLKIVNREEKVEKKIKKINKSWRKPRNRAVWTADTRSTAHRAADLYYYFPAPSD
jgi:hypothetical protein